MTDPYYKKTIEINYHKHHFKFDVANTIFSTFDIDLGTQLLLRTISKKEAKTLLDIGCGYGALGVILSKIYETEYTAMLDKDLLAVRYAKLNLQNNDIPQAQVFASIGLESAPNRKFDLIVSNIPAKIGDEAIEQEFILKPLGFLESTGEYWFVVVAALNRLIPQLILKNGLNGREIIKKNHYSVYRLVR